MDLFDYIIAGMLSNKKFAQVLPESFILEEN